MPTWWSKSSSKEAKRKTPKENFIGTLQWFINPTEHKGNVRRVRRHSSDITSEKGSHSRAESRSTSPSTPVPRCQSFADRPHAQPLPLPVLQSAIIRSSSGVNVSKTTLEKRGKPQLLLPLPKPDCVRRKPDAADTDADLVTASFSSNCSVDSEDAAESRLQSPLANDIDNVSGVANNNSCLVHKDQSRANAQKKARETVKISSPSFNNQMLSTPPKHGVSTNFHSTVHIPYHGAFTSAPDSSMSSPSRSPLRVCPEQISTSAFWGGRPYSDVTFLGSGQCSSPGSGQTSGHNSMGGDIYGQLFWQHSRGSPECSPIPSPIMMSPGPSSRIHSGAVSPLHPRAGGTTPESPSNRHDEGKKQSHRLPLPPINISNSPYCSNGSSSNTPLIPRSPGKIENPASPGSRWKKGRLIGRGTFGHVYVGFNSESGEMCAMKEVTLFLDDVKSRESAKQLGQEISLLSRLRHPNIVQYYGCDMIEDKLYIYLEYVSGGSIHKLLQEYGQFGEQAVRSYTNQILSGLAYLHAKNTVHRDIKGANILVDPSGRVKLADFGMAKHITGQSCPLSFKGSPYWMAPEVIKNTNGCNLAVDIWSLGCTVVEMATSKPPWSQFEGIAAMFKIGNSKGLPPIPDHLSEEGKDFIRQCLRRDPSQRPSAVELLHHPFVRNSSPLERTFIDTEPLEQTTTIPSGTYTKGTGHVGNLSSLDVEPLAVTQLRASKFTAINSDIHSRNIPDPVSPINSSLLSSRTSHHLNERMSPSPISSPRTISGSSTPLTGGSGTIPFNHPRQFIPHHESFSSTLKSPNYHYCVRSSYHDHNLFRRMQQMSCSGIRENILPENNTPSPQFGKMGYCRNQEPLDKQSILVDHMCHQFTRDQMMLSTSLDLCSCSPLLGHMNGG